MPITRSAKRALKKSLRKRSVNKKRKVSLKKIQKEFLNLVRENKMEEARKMLPSVYSRLDKSVKVHLIKENKAKRVKSQLAQYLNKAKDKK